MKKLYTTLIPVALVVIALVAIGPVAAADVGPHNSPAITSATFAITNQVLEQTHTVSYLVDQMATVLERSASDIAIENPASPASNYLHAIETAITRANELTAETSTGTGYVETLTAATQRTRAVKNERTGTNQKANARGYEL